MSGFQRLDLQLIHGGSGGTAFQGHELQGTPKALGVTGHFTISPAVSGKTTWNLDTDGPLNLGATGEWTITILQDFSATAKMWGAGGSAGGSAGGGDVGASGGGAGYVTATVAFVTAETFLIHVGEGGQAAGTPADRGGLGNSIAGNGGGFTGLFENSISRANALLMAGAGGGGGAESGTENPRAGGPGGGTTGGSSQSGAGTPATGGTQAAGGTRSGGGTSHEDGETDGEFHGGDGDNRGAGGGAGYYGGGGGGGESGSPAIRHGGAGGSNFILGSAPVSGGTNTQGSGSTPGNEADGDRSGAGQGGVAVNTAEVSGADGRVILTIVP